MKISVAFLLGIAVWNRCVGILSMTFFRSIFRNSYYKTPSEISSTDTPEDLSIFFFENSFGSSRKKNLSGIVLEEASVVRPILETPPAVFFFGFLQEVRKDFFSKSFLIHLVVSL